jgi:hypothetical protein
LTDATTGTLVAADKDGNKVCPEQTTDALTAFKGWDVTDNSHKTTGLPTGESKVHAVDGETACCSDTSVGTDDKMPHKAIPVLNGIRAKLAYDDTTNWIQESAATENIALRTPIDTQNLEANPGWTDYYAMSLTKCTGCEFEYKADTGKAGKKSFTQVGAITAPALNKAGDGTTEVYKYNSTHNREVAGSAVIIMRTTNVVTIPLRVPKSNINFLNDWMYAAEQYTDTKAESLEMFPSSDDRLSKYKKACAQHGTFSGTAPPAPGQTRSTTIVDRVFNSDDDMTEKVDNWKMFDPMRPFEIKYQFVKASVCMDFASVEFHRIADKPVTINATMPTSPTCSVKRAGECAVTSSGCTFSACSYSTSSLFATLAASAV